MKVFSGAIINYENLSTSSDLRFFLLIKNTREITFLYLSGLTRTELNMKN